MPDEPTPPEPMKPMSTEGQSSARQPPPPVPRPPTGQASWNSGRQMPPPPTQLPPTRPPVAEQPRLPAGNVTGCTTAVGQSTRLGPTCGVVPHRLYRPGRRGRSVAEGPRPCAPDPSRHHGHCPDHQLINASTTVHDSGCTDNRADSTGPYSHSRSNSLSP